MTTPQKVLAEAAKHIGYRDKGARFVQWYGSPPGTAWCAIFVSYVARQAGAAALIPRFQYTPTGAAWFKSKGQWGKTPKVGALVFFDFPDTVNRIQHVGIVEKVLPDGRIQTIEGNTSSGEAGSQYNGGGVYRRVRPTASVVGYGYPDYATVTGTEADMLPQIDLRNAEKTPVHGEPAGRLQGLLLAAGHGPAGLTKNGRPDKIAGSGTKAAVGAYQAARGLVKDHVVGPKTWAKLLGL